MFTFGPFGIAIIIGFVVLHLIAAWGESEVAKEKEKSDRAKGKKKKPFDYNSIP